MFITRQPVCYLSMPLVNNKTVFTSNMFSSEFLLQKKKNKLLFESFDFVYLENGNSKH